MDHKLGNLASNRGQTNFGGSAEAGQALSSLFRVGLGRPSRRPAGPRPGEMAVERPGAGGPATLGNRQERCWSVGGRPAPSPRQQQHTRLLAPSVPSSHAALESTSRPPGVRSCVGGSVRPACAAAAGGPPGRGLIVSAAVDAPLSRGALLGRPGPADRRGSGAAPGGRSFCRRKKNLQKSCCL